MNVRTERQTDRPHELHVYVGLAQARPKNKFSTRYTLPLCQTIHKIDLTFMVTLTVHETCTVQSFRLLILQSVRPYLIIV